MSSQILCQMLGQMPSQMPSQMHQRQQALGSLGQKQGPLPIQLMGQSAATTGQFSSASRAKPGLVPQAETKHLQDSESSEELMTLEELEGRIASLNNTLLRAPSGWQASHVVSDQAGSGEQSQSHGQVRATALRQQMPAHLQPTRSHHSRSQLGREVYSSSNSTAGFEEQPVMTAWQKLTAKHQAPQASSASHHNTVEGENAHGPVSSPARSTVSCP